MSSPAMAAEPIVAMAGAAEVKAEASEATAEVADQSPEAADVSAEAADAHDDAVLDMIALEMAATDPDDVGDPPDSETYELRGSYESQASYETAQVAALPPAEPIIVSERPEPVSAPAQPPASQPTLQSSFEPAPKSSLEPSLGSSLIASGIVRGPAASRPDPLAAIRRMSQAEKIAFFS
jgi:hypothetical protein